MFRFPPLTPLVKKLLIALLATYIGQIILENWVGFRVLDWIALYAGPPQLSTTWQLFTYPFAAPTGPNYVFSMLISCLFLWWMLAPFEMRFGPKRTIQLCVVATLGAAIPAILVGSILGPSVLYGTEPLLLASIAAFSWSYRGQGPMSFFGVIDMKPEHIIWLVLGISFLIFLASRDFVGLVADLGAVGAGIGFIEWLRKPPVSLRRKRKKSGGFRVIKGDRESGPNWLN